MAIKVGGTDVISNARALTNIASIDATTAASISAAGVGGGGEADFVATGAIANGDVVVLNSDGTVSVVSETITELNPVTAETAVAISGQTAPLDACHVCVLHGHGHGRGRGHVSHHDRRSVSRAQHGKNPGDLLLV